MTAWQASNHNQVQCVTCHVPPGIEGTIKHKFMALSMVANYFTGVYKRSKPWAEVEDTACLQGGCHETRLLKGTENFKGVVFDHTPHLTQPRRDRQLRCTSCHAQIVQGEHITVTETTCFLCHFKPDNTTGQATDLARCTHCHRPPTGEAAADTSFDHARILATGVACQNCHAGAVAGDGFVPKERCNTCHAKLEHIQRYDDLEFVHQKHVTEHKVECTNCHIAIRHGKQAYTAADDPVRPVRRLPSGRSRRLARGTARLAQNAIAHGPRRHDLRLLPRRTACTRARPSRPRPSARPATKAVTTPSGRSGTRRCCAPSTACSTEAKRVPGSRGEKLEQALALYREGNPGPRPRSDSRAAREARRHRAHGRRVRELPPRARPKPRLSGAACPCRTAPTPRPV